MPIRINLLAEQQATEELRRRDPVKRTTWIAGVFVGLLVLWSGYLQFKLMAASRGVRRVEEEWKKFEPDFSKVTTNLNRMDDAIRKWSALQTLASNRFLWAPQLSALQYVLVDDVQLVRLKTDQTYVITEGVKPSTNAAGVVSRGRPATSREKVVLTIEANDYSSPRPGDQISKFQEALNSHPYFKTNLQRVEMMMRSPPQSDGSRQGRSFVFFTLECQFPEKTR